MSMRITRQSTQLDRSFIGFGKHSLWPAKLNGPQSGEHEIMYKDSLERGFITGLLGENVWRRRLFPGARGTRRQEPYRIHVHQLRILKLRIIHRVERRYRAPLRASV